jgi:hypothetical protein
MASLMPWAIYNPSTRRFEVVVLCESAECKIPTRSYPIHRSAKLLIYRLAHALCVCLVLSLA